MTTLSQMKFLSSDEDDEDYIDSGGSSDESKSANKQPKNFEKKTSAINKIREKKMRHLLSRMTSDSLINLDHEPTVNSSDILLEFQIPFRSLTYNQKPTVEELFEYIDRTAGRLSPKNPVLKDIPALKNAVRSTNAINHERIKIAVDNLNNKDAEIRVEKNVRFAGQTVNIQQTMKRGSRKHQNYLKMISGNGHLGGALASLDSAMDELKSLQQVNSVEKSRSDWEMYREKHNLEQELHDKRKDGFLSHQAFLAAVDLTQQEMTLEMKKKRRLLMESK